MVVNMDTDGGKGLPGTKQKNLTTGDLQPEGSPGKATPISQLFLARKSYCFTKLGDICILGNLGKKDLGVFEDIDI